MSGQHKRVLNQPAHRLEAEAQRRVKVAARAVVGIQAVAANGVDRVAADCQRNLIQKG